MLKNNKILPDHNDCSALKLIKVRGEGLVKIISGTSQVDKQNKKFQKWENKWELQFSTLNNSNNISYENEDEEWDPLEEVSSDEIDYEAMLSDKVIMTSATLLPRDGKMRLFGSGYFSSCGILYDLRLCHLRKEKFVFDQQALNDFDWFFDPQTKHKEFYKNPHNNFEKIHDYTEILAGLNASAASAIVLQPPIDHQEKKYYINRFYAIDRKLFIAAKINRHLPIIILDAHKGPYEYTFETQQRDLKNFLEDEKNPNYEFLMTQNEQLNIYMPVEHENANTLMIIPTNADAQELLHRKLMLLGEQIRLMHEIHNLFVRFDSDEIEQDGTLLKCFNDSKEFLVETFLRNEEDLYAINIELKNNKSKTNEDKYLLDFIRYQEDVAQEMQNTDYFEDVLDKEEEDLLFELHPKALSAQDNFWGQYQSEIVGTIFGSAMGLLIISIAFITMGMTRIISMVGFFGLLSTLIMMAILGYAAGLGIKKLTQSQYIDSDEPEDIPPLEPLRSNESIHFFEKKQQLQEGNQDTPTDKEA